LVKLRALSILVFLGCTKSQPSAEVTVPPLPSASVASSATPEPAPMAPLATPELRVIVAAAAGRDFYFFRPEPASFFTPSDREVADLEAKLPAFLRASHPASRRPTVPLAERMPKYMRQYVGFVDLSGTRRIWGNFFCDSFGGTDWRTHAILVKDGGDCFFNVQFDPATGTFNALMVNGEG
jgi:hypothetical protein